MADAPFAELEMARALEVLQGVDVPDSLRGNMALFLRLVRRVLDESGLKANETLFIDDSETNCEAASRLGIHTYYNRDINDWTEEGES